METWKDIPGYGNYYQASNLGNIRVKDRVVEKFCGLHNRSVKQFYKGRTLLPSKNNKYGHLSVHLGFNKTKKTIQVHRLVLEAFVGPAPNGMECCHNNGIAWDNRIENLRWDTHKNNNADRKRHGTYPTGENHPMYGKKMPEELKQKLIHISKTRIRTPEESQRRSEMMKERWSKEKTKRLTNNAI
jgi:hypothetical protein